jgi:hypothetical protein
MFRDVLSFLFDVLVLNMVFKNKSHYALMLQLLLWSPGEGKERTQDTLSGMFF